MRAPLVLVALALAACEPTASPPTLSSGAGARATDTASAVAAPPADGAVESDAGAPLEAWLPRTLRAADPRWAEWLASAKERRLQVLVTVVEPGRADGPTHEYRVDAEYVYPASAIKPFIAVAALGALRERAKGELPRSTRILRCRDDRPDCEPPEVDEEKRAKGEPPPPAADGEEPKKKHEKLRLGEEVQKLLSYSDNDSYNRLYDIVGHRELNEAMVAIGFPAVRFHHRMDAPAERSRSTLRVLLMPPGRVAIEIPRRKSDLVLAPTTAPDRQIGSAHFAEGRRVDEPMSFDAKNYVPLRDLQRLLVALLLPDRAPDAKLDLTDKERDLLIRSMTARLSAARQTAEHHPLAPGVLEQLPAERVRYVGKSGRAYGFHLENAYVEDRESRRAFFVTATVYANPNGVLNDDDYGYDEISRPLLASLGSALASALLR